MKTKSGIKWGSEAFGIIDGMAATWRFVGKRNTSWALERIINGRAVETRFVDWATVERIFVAKAE